MYKRCGSEYVVSNERMFFYFRIEAERRKDDTRIKKKKNYSIIYELMWWSTKISTSVLVSYGVNLMESSDNLYPKPILYVSVVKDNTSYPIVSFNIVKKSKNK